MDKKMNMKKIICIAIFSAIAFGTMAQTPNALTPGSGGGGIDTFELNRSIQLDTFTITETNGNSYTVIRPKDVVLSNVAPTGTAIALTWWDTLTTTPTDSLWINHNGAWVYNAQGSSGTPPRQFSAAISNGSAASNFRPFGIVPDSAYFLMLQTGAIQMRHSTFNRGQMSDNGLNVYNDFKWVETDNDTLEWNSTLYNKALIEFEDVDAYVAAPTNLNSQWNSEVYVLEFRNISNVDSHLVLFDTLTYRTFNGNPMPDILVGAGGQYRSVAFKLEFAETGQLICMEDVEGGGLDSTEIADLGFLVNGGNDGPVTVGSNDDVTTIESNNVVHITFGDSGGGFTDFNGDDLDGIEDIDIDGRIKQSMGASVANAADITLGSGNLFHLTGNGTINTISAAGWKAGSGFRLIIDGIATILAHGAAGSGVSMALPGATNYNCIQNEVIYMVYDGVSWFLQK